MEVKTVDDKGEIIIYQGADGASNIEVNCRVRRYG